MSTNNLYSNKNNYKTYQVTYSDEFGVNLSFLSKKGLWVYADTDNAVDKDWYHKLKIDISDIQVISEIMIELENQDLIAFSLKKRRKAELDSILEEKLSNLITTNNYTPMVEHPYNYNCIGDSVFGWSRTSACQEALADVNSRCCSNSWCIGCCEVLGCDCFGVTGDYLVLCTGKGKACSGGIIY